MRGTWGHQSHLEIQKQGLRRMIFRLQTVLKKLHFPCSQLHHFYLMRLNINIDETKLAYQALGSAKRPQLWI